MYKKCYAVRILIRADDHEEAEMMADTMSSGSARGIVAEVREADRIEEWAHRLAAKERWGE